MSNPAFKSLLEKQADQQEAPKPLPVGHYAVMAIKHEFGQSSQKKTPYVRFFFQGMSAGFDVDADQFEACGGDERLGKVNLRSDFYLTEDALFMLTQFLEKLDIDMEGRSFADLIPEACANQPVIAYVGQRPSQRDPNIVFNEISGFLSQEEYDAREAQEAA